MKKSMLLLLVGWIALSRAVAVAEELSLQSAPPVVVKTVPAAGSVGVDPGLSELQVTFSKPMLDGSWSWSTWGEGTFPEMTGSPHYLADGRTCVLPVKLQPGKFYATWLNSDQFHNFRDRDSQPATPYLLTFETAGSASAGVLPELPALLNADQRLVAAWTEWAFRDLLESRTFEGWTSESRAALEATLLKSLQGEPGVESYRAIGSLAALRSAKAFEPLLALAVDRRPKDNRDRWLAVRALGVLGDKRAAPELIHLLYHWNSNTRWWAQISLVRLTGTNFGKDWKAWGSWWNERKSQPAWKPEPVRWLNDPEWSDPARLAQSVAHADLDFLAGIKNQYQPREPQAPEAELSREKTPNPPPK
jgi:Bacterial Ig-like domain/PBS lyase HEAT-like repeat